MRRLEIARQTPVVPMTSGCQRAANKYGHAFHEARYVVIYACSKSNEYSLRYSHFLGSSTERITLYNDSAAGKSFKLTQKRGSCCED